MIPPHKYQICKVRSADATGAGKFPAGLFGQVGFAYSTCIHGFTLTRSWGAGQALSPLHHRIYRCNPGTGWACPGQGEQQQSPGLRSPPRSEPGARRARNYSFPSTHSGLARVIKVTGAASPQLPSARGPCPNEGWGEASGTCRARSPLGSAPSPAPNTPPGKQGFSGHHKQTACFDRNQLKKIEGKIPFCEYSKCHCKLSVKQKLIFSPLQTPASFQFPTAKSLFLLPAVKVGKVK